MFGICIFNNDIKTTKPVIQVDHLPFARRQYFREFAIFNYHILAQQLIKHGVFEFKGGPSGLSCSGSSGFEGQGLV